MEVNSNIDDPDYSEFHIKEKVDRSEFQEANSRTQALLKIENIMEKEFKTELTFKRKELNRISDRINNVQLMLDRLRAYIVASYYGSGEKTIPYSKRLDLRRKRKLNEAKVIDDVKEVLPVNKLYAEKFGNEEIVQCQHRNGEDQEIKCNKVFSEVKKTINRFYVNRQIIVGNVSKYLVTDRSRLENDKSTHKWMVYVRGAPNEQDISEYIKSVRFFLHPSYIPNDIVQVNKPPFQITRRGWGEFPVRVQLNFKDELSKKCDIIHNLKLDKTFTGLQTLGAETVVNLELHRHTDGRSVVKYNKTKKATNNKVENDMPYGEAEELNDILKSESFIANLSECRNNELQKALMKSDPVEPPYNSSDTPFSSCVSSAMVSRCSSPTILKHLWKDKPVTINHDIVLRKMISRYPLYDSRRNRRYYTSNSLSTYKSWSFSKRRACEWQRALALKDVFESYKFNNPVFEQIPSTKQIMIWCRLNSFTPPETGFKVVEDLEKILFCNICGKYFTNDEVPSDSISAKCKQCQTYPEYVRNILTRSAYQTLIEELKQKENVVASFEKLRCLSKENEIKKNKALLDVLISPNTSSKYKYNDELCYISATPEEDWVYSTVSSIGIHLPSISELNTRKPVICSMMIAAMKLFIDELLRKSHQESSLNNKITLNPGMITIGSVYKVVGKVRRFEFLQDQYLGKLE